MQHARTRVYIAILKMYASGMFGGDDSLNCSVLNSYPSGRSDSAVVRVDVAEIYVRCRAKLRQQEQHEALVNTMHVQYTCFPRLTASICAFCAEEGEQAAACKE
eukprot:1161981-Pelagomonas_calceolata.AAC.11